MAISFPAPEAAKQTPKLETAKRAQEPPLLISAARLLKSGYQRLNSAIFDAEGDCMRL